MPVKDAFLAGVLAHVPEADRGKAEAALQALEEGGLRQSDYSKLAQEAREAKERFDALYGSNTEWFEEKKAALAETDALRLKVTELEKRPLEGKPADLPADLIRKADLEKILGETERGAVGFIAESNMLSMQHFQQFGELLNINDLLADKRVQQIGLRGVYADKYKEPIAAKAAAAKAAEETKLREEGAAAERAKFANRQTPYPVMGNEPSALDALEAARASGQAPVVKTVEDMAAEYARLTGVRASA